MPQEAQGLYCTSPFVFVISGRLETVALPKPEIANTQQNLGFRV